MSIWSRSHEDLAKLAKELQAKNDHSRINGFKEKRPFKRQSSLSCIDSYQKDLLNKGKKRIQRTRSATFSSCDLDVIPENLIASSGSCLKSKHEHSKDVGSIKDEENCLDNSESAASEENRCGDEDAHNKGRNCPEQGLNESKSISGVLENQMQPDPSIGDIIETSNGNQTMDSERSGSRDTDSAYQSVSSSVSEPPDYDLSKDAANHNGLGVSRQVLFLLQKDFINSAKGSTTPMLTLIELQTVLEKMSDLNSGKGGEKHKNMIKMVKTLILRQENLVKRHRGKERSLDERKFKDENNQSQGEEDDYEDFASSRNILMTSQSISDGQGTNSWLQGGNEEPRDTCTDFCESKFDNDFTAVNMVNNQSNSEESDSSDDSVISIREMVMYKEVAQSTNNISYDSSAVSSKEEDCNNLSNTDDEPSLSDTGNRERRSSLTSSVESLLTSNSLAIEISDDVFLVDGFEQASDEEIQAIIGTQNGITACDRDKVWHHIERRGRCFNIGKETEIEDLSQSLESVDLDKCPSMTADDSGDPTVVRKRVTNGDLVSSNPITEVDVSEDVILQHNRTFINDTLKEPLTNRLLSAQDDSLLATPELTNHDCQQPSLKTDKGLQDSKENSMPEGDFIDKNMSSIPREDYVVQASESELDTVLDSCNDEESSKKQEFGSEICKTEDVSDLSDQNISHATVSSDCSLDEDSANMGFESFSADKEEMKVSTFLPETTECRKNIEDIDILQKISETSENTSNEIQKSCLSLTVSLDESSKLCNVPETHDAVSHKIKGNDQTFSTTTQSLRSSCDLNDVGSYSVQTRESNNVLDSSENDAMVTDLDSERQTECCKGQNSVKEIPAWPAVNDILNCQVNTDYSDHTSIISGGSSVASPSEILKQNTTPAQMQSTEFGLQGDDRGHTESRNSLERSEPICVKKTTSDKLTSTSFEQAEYGPESIDRNLSEGESKLGHSPRRSFKGEMSDNGSSSVCSCMKDSTVSSSRRKKSKQSDAKKNQKYQTMPSRHFQNDQSDSCCSHCHCSDSHTECISSEQADSGSCMDDFDTDATSCRVPHSLNKGSLLKMNRSNPSASTVRMKCGHSCCHTSGEKREVERRSPTEMFEVIFDKDISYILRDQVKRNNFFQKKHKRSACHQYHHAKKPNKYFSNMKINSITYSEDSEYIGSTSDIDFCSKHMKDARRSRCMKLRSKKSCHQVRDVGVGSELCYDLADDSRLDRKKANHSKSKGYLTGAYNHHCGSRSSLSTTSEGYDSSDGSYRHPTSHRKSRKYKYGSGTISASPLFWNDSGLDAQMVGEGFVQNRKEAGKGDLNVGVRFENKHSVQKDEGRDLQGHSSGGSEGEEEEMFGVHTLKKIVMDFQEFIVSLSRDQQDSEDQERRQGMPREGVDRMESTEATWSHLDSEFDKVLADMKPYVLKLPHKSDRQKCAVWIKKLCEPPLAGITGRKNRNMYGQLMLHMLKRGVLEGPFDKKPADGPLTTLPPYMSIYFDEPMTSRDGKSGEEDKVPDWVNGELLESGASSTFRRSALGNPAATSTWMSSSSASNDIRQRPYSSLGVSLDRDPSLSPPRRSYQDKETKTGALMTDGDWTKPLSPTSTFSSTIPRGTTFQDDTSIGRGGAREIELRTKMIEAKYHEEKLKLQQKHDAAVQKILDRKNTEIEDIKNHYRAKAKDVEEVNSKLERKIQSLLKEVSMVRDSKDKQIAEIKKLMEDTGDSRKHEYDKRLHEAMAQFEQDKFEMQKQHTKNIQEILEDTNARLHRMEKEYTQQTMGNSSIIKELESRVQQLTSETEQQLTAKSGLEREKSDLQATVDQLTAELADVRNRYSHLEHDHQHLQDNHEHEMRTLKHKTEASLEFLKQEHTLSAAKATDAVKDMEQQLETMRRSLKDSDEQRHRQIRDLEQAHQQDKLHLENLHDKQIRSIKQELGQLEQETQKKSRHYEQVLQEKDLEIGRLKEQNREQALSAERALEEFKIEVDKNQTRMYEEMKQQMGQVEADLNKSKHTREKQNKELARQLEQERMKFDRQMTEVKIVFENEKGQMLHDFHLQKEFILSEHEKSIDTLKEGHRVELRSLDARYKERQDKDAKNLSEFDSQVRELREELVQSNQLRKQQLVELGLLREEEKQKMQRDHEAEASRMRSEMEQQRLELQKTHSGEMETLLEKTNQRLKDIEKEYADRGQKSTEMIGELQTSTNQLREEIKRIREQSDKQVNELTNQQHEDKKAVKKQYSSNVMALQKELDNQRNKCRNAERRLQRLEAEQEEKITKLKLNYEEKMRGLMPAAVRQELDETIKALRSQVNTLQQRAAVLQDELDLKIKNPLGSFGALTSSPIIKSSV